MNNPFPPDRLTAAEALHQRTRALLPDFATWQACGHDPRTRYPEMGPHLAECERCRQELEELVALLVAFSQPVTSLLPSIRPDLAFLGYSTPSPPVPASWVDEVGRWFVLFSQSFLTLFTPPPQYGRARGTFKMQRLEDARSGSTLTLEVREAPDSALASLLVKVDWPDQDPFELGGSRVTVRAADQQWEGVTDDTGSVEFGALPRSLLSVLRLEVSPAEG